MRPLHRVGGHCSVDKRRKCAQCMNQRMSMPKPAQEVGINVPTAARNSATHSRVRRTDGRALVGVHSEMKQVSNMSEAAASSTEKLDFNLFVVQRLDHIEARLDNETGQARGEIG